MVDNIYNIANFGENLNQGMVCKPLEMQCMRLNSTIHIEKM